jgi:predicted small secreted protein
MVKILYEQLMRVLMNTSIILALSFCVSSCNTFEGMGKDIKKGGEKLEDTANDHK